MSRSYLVYFATWLCVTVLASCIRPPDYGNNPVIEYVSISKYNVIEGNDSVEIRFNFTDGDGDLGPASKQDSTINMFLVDSRDESIKEYQLPNLTPGGNIKAISGEITVKVTGFACRAGVDDDEVRYSIYVKDRAGNVSNTIQTESIVIDCQ